MSKAISILISLGLLVAVDRTAEHWKHAHATTDGATVKPMPTDLPNTPVITTPRGVASNGTDTTTLNPTTRID